MSIFTHRSTNGAVKADSTITPPPPPPPVESKVGEPTVVGADPAGIVPPASDSGEWLKAQKQLADDLARAREQLADDLAKARKQLAVDIAFAQATAAGYFETDPAQAAPQVEKRTRAEKRAAKAEKRAARAEQKLAEGKAAEDQYTVASATYRAIYRAAYRELRRQLRLDRERNSPAAAAGENKS